MSDLKEYINNRKNIDSEFSENFEVGYENLKIGVLLKQMREKSGYTLGVRWSNKNEVWRAQEKIQDWSR